MRVRKAEWTDRPTLHSNCERHRHGVVGCARIVKETPNGAENTDFSASSFLSFFFFPSLSFPAIFRRILFQPDSPSYVAWPIEHAKIAFRSPLSFSPREEKLKRWKKWVGGEKGGERIGGFYYLNISTNIHASASSRENALATDVNVTASFHEQNRFSRKWGSLERNYIHYILERNSKEIVRPTAFPYYFEKRNCARIERVFVTATIETRVKEIKKNRDK